MVNGSSKFPLTERQINIFLLDFRMFCYKNTVCYVLLSLRCLLNRDIGEHSAEQCTVYFNREIHPSHLRLSQSVAPIAPLPRSAWTSSLIYTIRSLLSGAHWELVLFIYIWLTEKYLCHDGKSCIYKKSISLSNRDIQKLYFIFDRCWLTRPGLHARKTTTLRISTGAQTRCIATPCYCEAARTWRTALLLFSISISTDRFIPLNEGITHTPESESGLDMSQLETTALDNSWRNGTINEQITWL